MVYIGSEVKKRMEILSLTAEMLANRAFLELSDVESIINNEKSLDDIDEFDLELMSSVLYCRPEYFADTSTREKDLLFTAMNRGNDNEKSIAIKVKVQNFMNDLAFVTELMTEIPQ